MVRLHRAPFDKDEGQPVETVYLPDFPVHHQEATQTGHGGGDFFTRYHFAQAIRTGEQPYLNVYRAVDMSICGILAYRSALADSAPVDVPDFRQESERRKYEDDTWSPDPARRGPGQPLPSVLGDIQPTDEAVTFARQVWKETGHNGT